MPLSLPMLALLGLASCNKLLGERRQVAFGCNDIVAIGRIETLSYTPLTIENDLIGHSRFSMQGTIKRVLRGDPPERVVQLSGVAHSAIRGDVDFLMLLTPNDDGYTLESAWVWPIRPQLVPTQACDG